MCLGQHLWHPKHYIWRKCLMSWLAWDSPAFDPFAGVIANTVSYQLKKERFVLDIKLYGFPHVFLLIHLRNLKTYILVACQMLRARAITPSHVSCWLVLTHLIFTTIWLGWYYYYSYLTNMVYGLPPWRTLRTRSSRQPWVLNSCWLLPIGFASV